MKKSQTYECTLERFLADVQDHKLTILRDDGLYRHLRFKKDGTSNMYFDLVTWPGYLALVGDMGDFVFTRVTDMFEFFRNGQGSDKLRINTSYWAEKCVAGKDKIEEYSADKFTQVIREKTANYILDGVGFDFDREQAKELIRAVKDDVLAYADDGEYQARNAVEMFQHERFQFRDFWEADLQIYTYHYLWCCYALVWGIKQYDQVKAQTEPL